jgi:hypothetical protein
MNRWVSWRNWWFFRWLFDVFTIFFVNHGYIYDNWVFDFFITLIYIKELGICFFTTVIINSDTRNDTQWRLGAVFNNRPTLVYISTTLLANLLQICSPSPTHQHCNFQTTFKSTKTLHDSACQIIYSTFSSSSFSKYFFLYFFKPFVVSKLMAFLLTRWSLQIGGEEASWEGSNDRW